jgi:DNA-directed RNA polymerase specialized sigma24 family protein
VNTYPVEGRDWILDNADPLWPDVQRHPLADFIDDIIDSWGDIDDWHCPTPGHMPLEERRIELSTHEKELLARAEDRRALEMWAWERCTYRQIAEEFGLNGRPSGFYRVQRALERLRQQMEAQSANR